MAGEFEARQDLNETRSYVKSFDCQGRSLSRHIVVNDRLFKLEFMQIEFVSQKSERSV